MNDEHKTDKVPDGLLSEPEIDGSSRFYLHARALTIVGQYDVAKVFRVRFRHSIEEDGRLFYHLECGRCGARSTQCSVLLVGRGGSASGSPNFKCECVYLLRADVWERQLTKEYDEFLFVVTLVAHTPYIPIGIGCLDEIKLHIDKFEATA